MYYKIIFHISLTEQFFIYKYFQKKELSIQKGRKFAVPPLFPYWLHFITNNTDT